MRTAGRIVEVEAYLGHQDPASHGYLNRRHAQNEGLYGPAGSWYVYLSYGVHWCANLVCEGEGFGAGVLLRAAEPLAGVEQMRHARGRESPRELCSRSGRLAQAFGIDRTLDGSDVTGSGVITVLADGYAPDVLACPRIGLSKNAAAPLRFVVPGSGYLSRRP